MPSTTGGRREGVRRPEWGLPWGGGGGHGEAGPGLGKEDSWVGEPPERRGRLLGDVLVGVVILIFIPLVVPGQLLPLAQQTGHTHGPRDLAQWRVLLFPRPAQCHAPLQAPDHTQLGAATSPPVHSILDPHNSAHLLLFPHTPLLPSPRQSA